MLLFFSAIWLVSRLMNRVLGAWAAITVCAIPLVYLVQSVVRGMIHCAQDPTWIPPTEEAALAGSEGTMVFNCDSAGGMVDYFYLYVIAPLTLVSLGFLSLRYWRMARAIRSA